MSPLRVGTVQDVAEMLRVQPKWVYERAGLPVEEGGIPTLRRLGPMLRFDLDEVAEWLREESHDHA